MRIAILASGSGSNFEAIMKAVAAGQIKAEVVLVFADKKDAYVLERAKKFGVPAAAFTPKDFSSKAAYERALLALLQEYRVQWLVLAGYMRIVGAALLNAFPERIVNIHPALLPSFPGLHGIKDAFEAGVKTTGVTIHFVDAGVDTGPIIAQAEVAVRADDSLESLEERIHQTEHQLYPEVLAKLLNEERVI